MEGGTVGQRPPQSLDGYVQGALITDVKQAWVTVTTASEKAKKAAVGGTQLQVTVGVDNLSKFTTMVGALET